MGLEQPGALTPHFWQSSWGPSLEHARCAVDAVRAWARLALQRAFQMSAATVQICLLRGLTGGILALPRAVSRRASFDSVKLLGRDGAPGPGGPAGALAPWR
ncbi:unnamed protein product [Prorocentrum cordatum]|uniref:Uncharacterized protein n=1 Tax=Prorocentrum cordatum TaxID=2364126 RepID=A0ABN9SYU9_9DINO|nr:unnamed protein product [Polarella glacialis]